MRLFQSHDNGKVGNTITWDATVSVAAAVTMIFQRVQLNFRNAQTCSSRNVVSERQEKGKAAFAFQSHFES